MATKQVGDRSSGESSRAYTSTGEEETIVGFEEELTIIKEQLTGVPKKLDVISIIGMPGLGKTTLAKKVYNDDLVAYHFHIRAWITISQEYVKKDLLRGILSSVYPKSDEEVAQMSYDEVAQMSYKEVDEIRDEQLYKSLKGRRYLIVMDDIWDSRAWFDLKTCFPNDNNGSRIIFTSRHRHVALLAKSNRPPLSLRFLTDDESWVLFQQKVFGRETCPPQLTKIGKHVAKKCQGVPLVIVVVAGILTNEEKSPDEWKKVGKNLNSQMAADPQIWMKTLALSYNHLSHHLKPCFLYFGVFPEDYQVPLWQLIGLWVAEGFIRETGEKSLEDVAEEYLMELIGRSLVLVSRRRYDGGVKACGIHDLLRDFCIKQAEKECFMQQIFRELPVSYYTSIFGLATHSPFTKSELPDLDYPWSEFVRVLRTSYGMFSSYSRKIEKLGHLRYLEIGHSSYVYIPTTISNLKNLETLVISACCSVTLPHCIRGMVTLKHLHLIGKWGTLRIEEPGATYPFSLDNLQTLSAIDASSCRDFLSGIPNIRKLGIHVTSVKNGLFTLPHIDFLNHLQELKLWCCRFDSVPIRLCETRFPTNLKKLTLMESTLNWNEMSTLGKSLPNLEVLKLLRIACFRKCWKTSDGDFPQLKFLKLVDIPIEEWQVSSNHFPRLQRLVLLRCHRLQSIPYEVGEVPTLQMIEVRDCNISVANSAHKIKEEQVSMGNNWLQIVESGNQQPPRRVLRITGAAIEKGLHRSSY